MRDRRARGGPPAGHVHHRAMSTCWGRYTLTQCVKLVPLRAVRIAGPQLVDLNAVRFSKVPLAAAATSRAAADDRIMSSAHRAASNTTGGVRPGRGHSGTDSAPRRL